MRSIGNKLKWVSVSSALALGWAGAPAFAQGNDDDGSDETQAKDATDNHPTKVQMGPKIEGAKESSPGTVHTVVKGDTLWDLSARYLGSPWYWPKVWSYNPKIANPHWIYPGNQVRFYGGDEAPNQVEVADNNGDETGDEGDDGNSAASESSADNSNSVQVTGKLVYTAKSTLRASRDTFLTERELEETGTITGANTEALLLSPPDHAYVTFKRRGDVKVGDRYLIYRMDQKIYHPKTNDFLGYLTHVTGMVKVTSVDSEVVNTTVVECYDDIGRGDKVGPFGEKLIQDVAPKAADRQVKGYVVTPVVPYLTVLGERVNVILDRGTADGVQNGNSFTVVRNNDPSIDLTYAAGATDMKLPTEDIGSCMVVDAKEHASVCVVTRSLREVVAGDRVVMAPSGVKVGVLTK